MKRVTVAAGSRQDVSFNVRKVEKSMEELTIAELVEKLKPSRFTVRNNLSRLEWAGKVYFKNAGMAKSYFLREVKNDNRQRVAEREGSESQHGVKQPLWSPLGEQHWYHSQYGSKASSQTHQKP